MDSKAPAPDDQVPASVIAQAEAACAGNSQEHASTSQQPTSMRRQMFSRFQDAVLNKYEGGSQKDSASQQADNADPLEELRSQNSPPKYQDQLEFSQFGLNTKAQVTDDGRVNISIDQKTAELSDLLVPALRNQLSLVAKEKEEPLPPGYLPPSLGGESNQVLPPRLNVVIHVVGSRGDVQPFVALGKVLKSTYGHRVRLATHPTFKSFVEDNGLEFFSIGGDPAELMAFMVKNPGLMPGTDSLKSGDVGKRRSGIEEILLGCWRSCIEAGDGLGVPVHESTSSANRPTFEGGINTNTSPTEKPFIADAIIANPPSFAHIHIAEKLGIPLHIMFTMPWTSTQSFPHPLANIQSSNTDVNMVNFVSYVLVEMMTWQGLGDIINRFRERILRLEAISLLSAPGMLSRLKIPHTYCWSPALIPKPNDWAQHISVSGFFFLNLASSYEPDPELAAFLASGPPPVYIGFGSIVVDDPDSMTNLIFEASKKAGIRALVSKGWGGLGGDALDVPEGIFMLGNVPHDWLFKHVSCVVHHGGAGTSAAGISLGKPTVVVPFFGDQPWWGAMIHRAGAGPAPMPYKELTADKLAAALTEALKPNTLQKAQELGSRVSQEDGTEIGGKCFHDHLNYDALRCSLSPERVAVWEDKKTHAPLSALSATVLANEGLLNFADLTLYRAREYETDDGPWDPISGGASALLGTISSLTMGVADVPVEVFKSFGSKKKAKGSTGDPSTSHGGGTEVASESEKTAGSSSTELASQTSGGELRQSRTTSQDKSKPLSSSGAGSNEPSERSNIDLNSAVGASKGVSRVVGAGLKSPMDFTLGLARGFHNAPKLYGDDTVRPKEKVTGFQSGIKAAGKGFGYGFFDGISGLVTQPMKGAEQQGTSGLVKGIGRGIGGLVLKPGAAIWGLPGYTMMGIHKEVRKMHGSSVQNYIISARTAQGHEQWTHSTDEERLHIINNWKVLQSSPQNWQKTNNQSGIERRSLHVTSDEKSQAKSPSNEKQAQPGSFFPTSEAVEPAATGAGDFEQAIGASVRATSRGNHDEDIAIERAIRASVRELQAHRQDTDNLTEQEALNRAIQASIAEAGVGNHDKAVYNDRAAHEDSIRRSLAESMGPSSSAPAGEGEDEDLKQAIEESRIHHQEQVSKSKTEEEVVLEYVQKQSLAEEEHKKAIAATQKTDSKSDGLHDWDDEDLRRAIEESKKT